VCTIPPVTRFDKQWIVHVEAMIQTPKVMAMIASFDSLCGPGR
jgi:hypothetical protein